MDATERDDGDAAGLPRQAQQRDDVHLARCRRRELEQDEIRTAGVREPNACLPGGRRDQIDAVTTEEVTHRRDVRQRRIDVQDGVALTRQNGSAVVLARDRFGHAAP
jgi:hypothetical protein